MPPFGAPCRYCREPIVTTDEGFLLPKPLDVRPVRSIDTPLGPGLLIEAKIEWEPYHLECLTRASVGSVGHQLGKCPCQGGTLDDPPELSKREAARVAHELFLSRARITQPQPEGRQ